MPVYSPQFKEQIVKKMMPPSNQSVAQVSRDSGVAVPTLYSWKKLFRSKGFVVPTKASSPHTWDSKAKLAAVIQVAAMNEAQRSEYCRQHGGSTPNSLMPGEPPLKRSTAILSRSARPPWQASAKSSNSCKKKSFARTRHWPKRPPCWCCQKKPRPSGAPKRKTDSSGNETDGH